MKILLLTPWNTICGVSEMAYFLVQALEDRGHQFIIVANYFAGDYQSVGVRLDGANVHRLLGTGFAPEDARALDLDRAMLLLTTERPDVVVLNYQDYVFADKRRLNGLLQAAKDLGCRTALLLHDNCISRELATGLFDHVIIPPTLEFLRATVIDQGIPELDLSDSPFQHDLNLPWSVACFGLGRNRTQALINTVNQINEQVLLSRPLQLCVHLAKPSQFGEFSDSESGTVTLHRGYKNAESLGASLHSSHACVIWYPEIAGRSTSSAFRFAVGSQVPIICNQTNWVADQRGNGCWIEVPQDTPEAFKAAIIRTFQPHSYAMMRDRMTRLQRLAIQRAGWSEIARQYEALLQS